MKLDEVSCVQVKFDEVLCILGNRDQVRGYKLLQAIATRISYARAKHPVFAIDEEQAVDVVGSEWGELRSAVENHEGPQRVFDESLDVIATAVRMASREWEENADAIRAIQATSGNGEIGW